MKTMEPSFQPKKDDFKISRVNSINFLYNNKLSYNKKRMDSPERLRNFSTVMNLNDSLVLPVNEVYDDMQFVAKGENESPAPSEASPGRQKLKIDENIIFTYIRVMKNLTVSFDKNQECEYIITEETGDESFDIKKWFDKCFYTIIRFLMFFGLLYFNYLLIKFEMFLGVYMYIILVNNTRKSILSQDIKQMSMCLKRW